MPTLCLSEPDVGSAISPWVSYLVSQERTIRTLSKIREELFVEGETSLVRIDVYLK